MRRKKSKCKKREQPSAVPFFYAELRKKGGRDNVAGCRCFLAASGRIFDGFWHVSGAIQRFFPMIQPKNPPFWKTRLNKREAKYDTLSVVATPGRPPEISKEKKALYERKRRWERVIFCCRCMTCCARRGGSAFRSAAESTKFPLRPSAATWRFCADIFPNREENSSTTRKIPSTACGEHKQAARKKVNDGKDHVSALQTVFCLPERAVRVLWI